MAYNYLLTNEADNDLSEIFDYSEYGFGFDQAVKYLERFSFLFKEICKNPKIGKMRSELGSELFCLPEKNHLIFYRITNNTIIISRILHSSRDLKNFL